MRNKILLSTLVCSTLLANANDVVSQKSVEIETTGEIRLGAVSIKDEVGERTSTLSLGGRVGLTTKPLHGLSAGVTFYTTNALFGKNSEGMFLDSNAKNYSLIGEAYLQGSFDKTIIKIGRQLFETPFVNGDDIGMIPNTIEGYSLFNQNIPYTTIVMGWVDKWAGVDSAKAEQFTKLQRSGDALMLAGAIYKGIENTTLQAWHYKLEKNGWSYVEASYERENWSMAGQYANQGKGDSIYGFDATYSFKNLLLHTAYNEVSGVVSNGFGGGPFFTSSEEHTVHERLNNKAILMGLEYSVKEATFALSHVNFSKSEDETDYLLSYEISDNLSADLIFSDMNHDGKMSRFFVNYGF